MDAIKALVFSSRLAAIFPMVSPPAVAMPAAAAILRKLRRVHKAVLLFGKSSWLFITKPKIKPQRAQSK
jgi:hypothetical protein